jgi:hypothetical protein
MTEPTSNVPLAYYNDSRDPWRPMVRLMALAAIAQGGITLLAYLSQVAFVLCQPFLRPAGSPAVSLGALSWFDTALMLIASTILIVGGALARRLHSTGRRWILVGAAIYVGAIAVTFCTSVAIYVPLGGLGQKGWGLILLVISTPLFKDLELCLIPAVIWIFFRRREVAALFPASRL